MGTIDSLFSSQISDMHGIPFDDGGGRSVGCGWNIDPAFGYGTYWYLTIDDAMAIVVFDLLFYEDIAFGAQVPNFFCFGSYGNNMVPYFAPIVGDDEGWEHGTLLGYAWHSGTCSEVAHAGKPLSVASISLLPQAVHTMAQRLGCDPSLLTSAISGLDGSHRILPLLRLFEEVKQARCGRTAARVYYECKAVEACALVVDWWEQQLNAGAQRIRPTDRTAFNLASAYVRANLDRQITLDDLCRASCVSASKLTGLFKSIEGTTPLGFVRSIRMEHARRLLEEGDEPLSRVAAAVGFTRQGSFSEAFKERYGITPSRYRAYSRYSIRQPTTQDAAPGFWAKA